MTYLKLVGCECKRLRRSLNITQQRVADETGYTTKSISAFEHGRVNNAIILLWYVEHGLKGVSNNGKK